MIPKVIHQIFYPFYFKEMPEQWVKNIQVWKNMHPSFQHKLWGYDESLEFLKQNYPWFVETWENYPHNIQKCDAIRYFILYHYGGLYADLDLIPLRPIDNLMEYDMLIVESGIGGGYTNSFLGVKPGHEFFKLATEGLQSTVNKFWFLGKHMNVMFSTGPAFLTNIKKEYKGNDIFTICSRVYHGDCTPCSDTTDGCNGFLFGHTDGKSWNKWDTKLLNHLYCNRKEYIILILLIVVFMLWYFGFYKKCRVRCSN